MANKAERQLKELRRLMPWNWDSKVEEHPPGEKAMHDFEDVLAYNLDRRRRVFRPPSPAKPAKQQANGANGEPAGNNKGPARKPKLTPALSPNNENVKVPSSTGAAHQIGKVYSEDRQKSYLSLPKSTARHPAPSAAIVNEIPEADGADEAHDAPLASPDSIAADISAVETVPSAPTAAPTAAATGGRPYVTPANRRKAVQTPSSKPSTSRNHAALADGQFQPTPRPTATPATVTAHNKGNNASFRSPQPRTVFGNKRKAATSMEDGLINNGSSIARLATSSPLAAKDGSTSAGRSKKPQQQATREPMESISLNLNQYKKGPVISRPDSCPPLFKTSASAGILAKRYPLPPLPTPSAQKTSQAAALSGQFFSQEKGLVAFMSGKKVTSVQQQQQYQYPALMPRAPMPLVVPAIAPLVTDGPNSAPAVGSTLGWAFSQLRQQQE